MECWQIKSILNKKITISEITYRYNSFCILNIAFKNPTKSVAVNTNLHVKQVGALRSYLCSLLPSNDGRSAPNEIEKKLPLIVCWVNIVRSYRASQGENIIVVLALIILRHQRQKFLTIFLQKSCRFR